MLSKSDVDKRQFIKKYGFILNQYRSNLPGYTSVSTATALFILQAILAGYQSWIEKEPDVKSTLLQAVDFSAGDSLCHLRRYWVHRYRDQIISIQETFAFRKSNIF